MLLGSSPIKRVLTVSVGGYIFYGLSGFILYVDGSMIAQALSNQSYAL